MSTGLVPVQLGLSYLLRIKTSDLVDLFKQTSDETLACLAMSYHQLSNGTDWLYPGYDRGEGTHFRYALEAIPETRQRKLLDLYCGNAQWTPLKLAFAEAEFRNQIMKQQERRETKFPLPEGLQDIAPAKYLASSSVSTGLAHLLKCDDRGIQTFYRTFLSTAVWGELCRGLHGEPEELSHRFQRNMTTAASSVFTFEMRLAANAPTTAILDAKLSAMAHLASLVESGRIILSE